METAVKLHTPVQKLPSDVWECIASHLSTVNCYHLAKTNKHMWEIIRHIPLPMTLNINEFKSVLSFFLANIRDVSFESDDQDLGTLKKLLSEFYHLESVDFSEMRAVSSMRAKKLLYSLPRLKNSSKLLLYVNRAERSLYEDAKSALEKDSLTMKFPIIRSLSMKRKVNDKDSFPLRKRLRSPSPLRDDIDAMESKIVEIKDIFGKIGAAPETILPEAIRSMCSGIHFEDSNLLSSNEASTAAQNKKDADAFVERVCGKMVESIAISSNGSFIFISQVEAYLRNSTELDDCANTTITVGFPNKLLFVVEQKREYRNQWYEAKAYYKNFEFLVTGCLCGNLNNDNVTAFLGASLGANYGQETYWRLYVPVRPVSFVKCPRLLRNFAKKASGYEWLLKSARFHQQGFSTACPLDLHIAQETNCFAAAASLMLHWKVYGRGENQDLIRVLKRSNEMEKIDFQDVKSKKNDRVLKSLKLSKARKLLIEVVFLHLCKEKVEDTHFLQLYKSVLSWKLKDLNIKAIRRKKYELVI